MTGVAFQILLVFVRPIKLYFVSLTVHIALGGSAAALEIIIDFDICDLM